MRAILPEGKFCHFCQLGAGVIFSCCVQVPHDQPLVAQAMIEQWVHGALKQHSGIGKSGALSS